MLEEGHLDAAFISYSARSNRLRTELVFGEELVLIAPMEGPTDAEALNGAGLPHLPSVYLVSAGERTSGRGLALFVRHCRHAFANHAGRCL